MKKNRKIYPNQPLALNVSGSYGSFSTINLKLFKDEKMTEEITDVTQVEIGSEYYYDRYYNDNNKLYITNILMDNKDEIVFAALDKDNYEKKFAFSFKNKTFSFKQNVSATVSG